MSDLVESPEGVAWKLFKKILEQEDDQAKSNEPVAAKMLDLYAECLGAVNGDRFPIDGIPPTQWCKLRREARNDPRALLLRPLDAGDGAAQHQRWFCPARP
jgi:hypothetical protein